MDNGLVNINQESYEANDSSLGTWLKTHECIPDEECGLGSIHQVLILNMYDRF